MYLNVLLLLVFVACFASLMNGGIWSNTLALINVATAGLLATNYFEPVAAWFDSKEPAYTYVWDMFALWLLFGVFMLVLRAATDYMSDVKVRFLLPVDKYGGMAIACWVGWLMVCFTTMSLHTAPLARNFLGGAFQPDPNAKMFLGLGPDRVWLGWVHRESLGPFCRLGELAPFDAQGDFILRYAERRAEFEDQLTLSKPGTAATPAMPGQP